MTPTSRSVARSFVSSRGVRLAVVIVATACAREQPPRIDSAVTKSPAAPAATTRADSASPGVASAPAASSNASAPTCLSEGAWQPCSVEKRLTDAGFVPIKKGVSPAGVFTVAGTTYALGPAELHVYLFRSAAERVNAVNGIDTVTVSRRGSPSPWAQPPTLITSNNLVAVLVSDNGRLIERVQNAITAGLPTASH